MHRLNGGPWGGGPSLNQGPTRTRCGDLAAVDGDTLSELLCEASAEVNRAQARRLAIAAEWDRRQAWADDGAYNGRCWLAGNCGLSRREASSVLHTAEVVASAPVAAAAVQEGVVPVAKAEVLAAGWAP